MPFRDPAFRTLLELAPSIVGGFLAAVLHLFMTFASPRPWPPGFGRAALIEAALAWLVGTLVAVFVGPMVGHFLNQTNAEVLGGIRVILGVVAWRALPIVRDKFGEMLGGLITRKGGEL